MAYEYNSSPPLTPMSRRSSSSDMTSRSSSSSGMPSSPRPPNKKRFPLLRSSSSSNLPSSPCPPPSKKAMTAIRPDKEAEDLLGLYTNGSRELPAESAGDAKAKSPPRARLLSPPDEDDQRPVREIPRWEDVKTPSGVDAYLPLSESTRREHARMLAYARRVNQQVDDFKLGGPPQSDGLPSS